MSDQVKPRAQKPLDSCSSFPETKLTLIWERGKGFAKQRLNNDAFCSSLALRQQNRKLPIGSSYADRLRGVLNAGAAYAPARRIGVRFWQIRFWTQPVHAACRTARS